MEGVVEVSQRLTIGPMTLRFFCREYRAIDRLLGLVAAIEVMSQHFCDFVGTAGEQIFERVSDGAVTAAAMPLEQAFIDRLLRQRMPKDIYGPFRLDALVDEVEAAQLAQVAQEEVTLAAYRAQQQERNFSADHRSRLKKLFRFLRQSIGFGHHDIVDRVRNHQDRSKVPRLARVQRELLEEEWVAVGLGNNFLGYLVSDALSTNHRANHAKAVLAA